MNKRRGTNFSNTEKYLLIELAIKYKDIIENKRTDAVFSKEKNKCWDNICKEFNSESSTFRDTLTLKNCWENLKKRTRKYYAEERSKLYKTGGGPCESQYDPIMEKIYGIIKPSVDGLNNEFDNDNIENDENFHYEINRDRDDNSNFSTMEELLKGAHQSSSDAEDCILKYINTIQDTSDSSSTITDVHKKNYHSIEKNIFHKKIKSKSDVRNSKDYNSQDASDSSSITTDIDKKKYQNIERNIFNKEVPLKKDIKSDKDYKSQFQDITNNETFSRDNEFNDFNDSLTNQKQVAHSDFKINKKTAVLNMLKKKIQLKPETLQENTHLLQNDYVRTAHEKRIDSISKKTLHNSILIDSKTELIELMKMDFQKKHEIEINILNTQLQREKLQMQLIQKELAIKDCILNKLQHTEITLKDTEYL